MVQRDQQLPSTPMQLQAPSIEIGPSGTLKLFKSFQAYEFNNAGMVRNAMTSPLATGAATLQQSYQIAEKDVKFIRTLGQGASGLVQKAFWPAKAEFVAIKKISVLEREKRHQLMNDIKALCNVPDIEGLIRFRGAYHCADRGQIAVALEYMDGGSLVDVVEKVSKIPEDVLSSITRSVLHGLAYLHTNHTVHRDIKPANILMNTSGEAKVSDFGISAFVDNTIAQCHTFLGTVTYMSPERINGQPYSFPADIWALGLTLLECATGRYPYDASGGTIQLMIQLLEDDCPLPPEGVLSQELCDFIKRCMAKDPMKRPCAEELLHHPFIMGAPATDLKKFMRCMYNPDEKAADAMLTITSRFFNNLSYNWSDSDSIAAFYAPDAVFTSGPAGAAPGSTTIQRLKGKYTIADHYHAMMEQLAGEVAFDVQKQQHRWKEVGSSETVPGEVILAISQRVYIRDEKPAILDGVPERLGAFEETMKIRIFAMDGLAPGVGFVIASHDVRWTLPLRLRKVVMRDGVVVSDGGSGLAATPPKCRQQ